MEEKPTLAKARQELEDLYLGVPDDSVDLTFKDLASLQQNEVEERKPSNMEPIRTEETNIAGVVKMDTAFMISKSPSLVLGKSPSLDFSKALEGVLLQNNQHRHDVEDELYREHVARNNFRRNSSGLRMMQVERSQAYNEDDINASALSMASPFGERGGVRRRPGIPHSNVCALCSVYIYLFRHRCLVCGRVYCRQCLGRGMGEMTEGRKCIECLGRRFSQRYIKRAGQTGCCWRYPGVVKQQELMWAERGPRRSGERRYRSGFVSRSQSPVIPGSPTTRSHAARSLSPEMPGTPSRSYASRSRSPLTLGTAARSYFSSSPPSFVASSTFSPNPHAFPL